MEISEEEKQRLAETVRENLSQGKEEALPQADDAAMHAALGDRQVLIGPSQIARVRVHIPDTTGEESICHRESDWRKRNKDRILDRYEWCKHCRIEVAKDE